MARWRFAVSSTMRGIYVIRLLLFAGGTGIALALAERGVLHTERPLLGLCLGFGLGLIVFRAQLRPLKWPRLYLSQTALHLVQPRRVITLRWDAVSRVEEADGMVAISLHTPMLAPDGQPAEAIRLEARKFGAATAELTRALQAPVTHPEARAELPPDDQVQRVISPPKPAPDGR